MADITIHDLLVWEPQLQLARHPLPVDDLDEREVTWATTIRAAMPMLNPLRGGELVLLPDRVLAETGPSMPELLRELASLNVSAAIVETPPVVSSPLPLLVAPELSVEFETELNRTLTERRGELYRAGMELGRILSGAAPVRDVTALIAATCPVLGYPLTLFSARGAVLAHAGESAPPAGAANVARASQPVRAWRQQRYVVPLGNGACLWVGPVPAHHRALARLAADRIALAVEALMRRVAEERPRGAARSEALNAALRGPAEDAERTATLLGLPPSGSFRVVLADPGLATEKIRQALHPYGELHPAGLIGGALAMVLELRGGSAMDGLQSGPAGSWMAVSAVVRGADRLPEACRQARYLAALIERGALPPGRILFDRVADTGVFQLLYGLRGTDALSGYLEDALGALRAADKRGTLRRTFLAYLNAGGSQTDTAAALDIHRNTLTYRLRQIAQLTGHDPNDPATRLAMHIALAAEHLPDEG